MAAAGALSLVALAIAALPRGSDAVGRRPASTVDEEFAKWLAGERGSVVDQDIVGHLPPSRSLPRGYGREALGGTQGASGRMLERSVPGWEPPLHSSPPRGYGREALGGTQGASGRMFERSVPGWEPPPRPPPRGYGREATGTQGASGKMFERSVPGWEPPDAGFREPAPAAQPQRALQPAHNEPTFGNQLPEFERSVPGWEPPDAGFRQPTPAEPPQRAPQRVHNELTVENQPPELGPASNDASAMIPPPMRKQPHKDPHEPAEIPPPVGKQPHKDPHESADLAPGQAELEYLRNEGEYLKSVIAQAGEAQLRAQSEISEDIAAERAAAARTRRARAWMERLTAKHMNAKRLAGEVMEEAKAKFDEASQELLARGASYARRQAQVKADREALARAKAERDATLDKLAMIKSRILKLPMEIKAQETLAESASREEAQQRKLAIRAVKLKDVAQNAERVRARAEQAELEKESLEEQIKLLHY